MNQKFNKGLLLTSLGSFGGDLLVLYISNI